MQSRPAATTFAYFVFRFAALAALTVGVLASVSVRASRDEGAGLAAPAYELPDTAEAINDRRYPLVYDEHTPSR